MEKVWVIGAYSPGFHVVAVCTQPEQATQMVEQFPKEGSYTVFEVPVDQFVGYLDKAGRIKDGMGRLPHQHFAPESD